MISKSEMARQLQISRPTLDKLLKEHEMNFESNS
ncbi:MAG: helix-turn-helix domain-containing protein [Turicibacter sanguinis]